MTRRNTLLLAGVVAALAAGAYAVSNRSGTDRGASTASPSASNGAGGGTTAAGTAASGDASSSGARDLHLGAAFTYAVTSTFEVVGSGKMATDGKLVLAVVGSTPGGDAKVRGELAPSKPFFVEMKPNGAVVAFHFTRGTSGDDRRKMRAVLGSLEVLNAPPDAKGGPKSWEATEDDATGRYVASYAGGDSVVKTKLRYEAARTPRGLKTPAEIGATYTIGHAVTQAKRDASGWPSELVEDEEITVALKIGATFASRGHTVARLVDRGEAKQYLGSWEAAEADFDPDTDASAEDTRRALHNADLGLVKGASFAELAAAMTSADSHGRHRGQARMSALLRLDPSKTADARAKLLAKDGDPKLAREMAGALGGAGTPEAQKALADAVGADDLPRELRQNAAVSLALQEQPTADAKDALSKAAASSDKAFADSSMLALGSLVKNGEADGQDMSDTVTKLIAQLDAATTADARVLYLNALGNTGDPRATDPILARTSAPEVEVRAAAVNALRFESGDAVVAAVGAAIVDASATIRRAAFAAVVEQSAAPYVDAFTKELHTDPDASVRLAAIRPLARSVNVAGVEQLLAWAATKDPDAKVRDAATAALSKGKPNSGSPDPL